MGNYKAYAEFKMGRYEKAREVWQMLAGWATPMRCSTSPSSPRTVLANRRTWPRRKRSISPRPRRAARKPSTASVCSTVRAGHCLATSAKARRYFALAADNGDDDAADRLAALEQPERALGDFEQAESLASRGEHGEAAVLYQRAADAGNLKAATRLAWIYEAGRGVPRDLDEAARRFTAAAEAGDAEAQYALAVMYRTGKGRPQDRQRSLKWLERAAAQHHPAANAALAAERAQR